MTPTSGLVIASAHGRVNLIGEHTDYNGGFVLPTVIPQRTRVTLRVRADDQVVVRSDALRETSRDGARYTLGQERRRGDWLDYIQGVTQTVTQTVTGAALSSGCDVSIASDVPLGAGLSSSAALEVALLRAVREAYGLAVLDDVQIAQLGQRAENAFVGARCGIMDQMAASLADQESALFLDTRSLEFRRVPLPRDADLVVIHSGVTHSVASGDYNRRRAECEAAAAALGVAQLRDVTAADLPRVMSLPEPLGRRARHVITENQRVLDAVAALEAGDLRRLGELFAASHASMRADFAISTSEVDLLVTIATADADVYGARLTGGGFGGSVVILAGRDTGRAVGERVAARYAVQSGCTPTVLVPAPQLGR